jgi:hypothetical protein
MDMSSDFLLLLLQMQMEHLEPIHPHQRRRRINFSRSISTERQSITSRGIHTHIIANAMGFADASKAAKRCSARLPNEMVGAAATISRLTHSRGIYLFKFNLIWRE